jgi:type II secretory pathway component GspD/PulD (secretin)
MMRSSPLAVIGLVFAAWFWPTDLPAQAPAATTPATAPSSTSERLQTRVLRLQFASAAVLADVLGQFLPQLSVRPESASNALVVTGTAEQITQAEAVVKRLDLRPDAGSAHSRDVQLSLLEYAAPTAGEHWSTLNVDALLDGSEVPLGLALRNDYRLRTIDQVPATLQLSASVAAAPQNDPRVVGRVPSSQPPSAGTLVRITTRPHSDGRVLVDYQLEVSSFAAAGDAQSPPARHTLTASSSVAVEPGKATVLMGFVTRSPDVEAAVAACSLLVLRVRSVE